MKVRITYENKATEKKEYENISFKIFLSNLLFFILIFNFILQ